jgi:hypothetical protein
MCAVTDHAITMLYHYTSVAGLAGILGSRTFWATHVSFLNDSSEFRHAVMFAQRMANELWGRGDYASGFAFTIQRALEDMTLDPVYVSSFSEAPDLLSQWRGYSHRGAGVCLGFDADVLKMSCERLGYRLEKCLYDQTDQARQIQRLVELGFERFPKPPIGRDAFEALSSEGRAAFIVDCVKRSTEEPDAPRVRAAVDWFRSEIAQFAPLFKDAGFQEEVEWRIIAIDPKEAIRFRAAPSYLIPYVELPIPLNADSNALREVIIGPNPNQARCEASVRILLEVAKMADVDVASSPVPYNNW